MTALPWSERINMLSINPDAASRDDIAKLAADLIDAKLAIASRDAVICGLREALDWSLHLYCGVSKGGGKPNADEYEAWSEAAKKALSAAPKCPHKEKLEEAEVRAALVEKMRAALNLCIKHHDGFRPDGSRRPFTMSRENEQECGRDWEYVIGKAREALSLPVPTALAQHDEEVRREAFQEAAKVGRQLCHEQGEGELGQEVFDVIRALAASQAGKGEQET